MQRQRFCLGLLVTTVLGLLPLLTSFAAPLRQAGSSTLVSNQGQAADQPTDRTLLQTDPVPLPDPQWDRADYDDSGWPLAFPVIRQAPWNSNASVDPILSTGADHIWGGSQGAFGPDAGNFTTYPRRDSGGGNYSNGFAISALTPQTLFLRKPFCLPLDADTSLFSGSDLELMLATDYGPTAGAAFLNEWPVNTNLPGDGAVHNYSLAAAPFQRGQNALALWARDNRGDGAAAILYRFTVDYVVDPNALTVAGPASAHVNQPVAFNANHDGLSSGPPTNRPLSFEWNMGDGTVIATGPAPTVNYTYPAIGTYSGVLTVTESSPLGCTAVEPFTITVDTAVLDVVKTDRFDPVAAGDFIDYDLTVRNTGAVLTFGDTTVTDQVPADTTYVSCTGGLTCGEAGGVVSWNVGPLNPGASAIVSFRVLVDNAPPPDPPVITNATYGAGSGGGVVFNATTPITTTIVVLGTPTPTPTNTPTATPTDTPTPTLTNTPVPPQPTNPPRVTVAPTTTPVDPTPAFLPESGREDSRIAVWSWVGLVVLASAVFWFLRYRRTVNRQ